MLLFIVNNPAPYAKILKSATQRKFCNFLYSNNKCADSYRIKLFHAISSYKHVDSGGNILNNIGNKVEDKISWQQEYKFSIACENCSQSGYTIEKIADALHSGTVPIYWGNPCIEKDFSKECFINAMNFSSLDDLIKHVKYIEENDEEYLKILNAPKIFRWSYRHITYRK